MVASRRATFGSAREDAAAAARRAALLALFDGDRELRAIRRAAARDKLAALPNALTGANSSASDATLPARVFAKFQASPTVPLFLFETRALSRHGAFDRDESV